MSMDAQPAKPRLKRTSLAPLTLDQALAKAMEYKTDPKPQRGGRKPKPLKGQ